MTDWGTAELPPGWVWAELGDLADVQLGKMLDTKRQTGKHPMRYLRNVNVQWHRVDVDDLLTMDVAPEECERYTVRAGDLLVCEGGEPGRSAVVGPRADGYAFQKALHRIRPAVGVSSQYLAFVFEVMARNGVLTPLFTGSTIRHLPREKVLPLQVPLPPADEQYRIVERLAACISTLESQRAALVKIGSRLVRLRRALRRALLTSPYPHAPLDEVVEVLDHRRVPVSASERAKRPGSVPYYGAAGQVGTIDTPLFDETLLLLGEDGVQFFDVDRAKAYIISGPSWVNNHAHVLRVRPAQYNITYLKHYLDHFNYDGYANGTTRLKLTKSAMLRIPVPVVPVAEQGAALARLGDQLTRVSEAKDDSDKLLLRLTALRGRLLTSAVKGELVNQDLADEPADVLLKRIADDRATRTSTPRRKGRSTVRSGAAKIGPQVGEST